MNTNFVVHLSLQQSMSSPLIFVHLTPPKFHHTTLVPQNSGSTPTMVDSDHSNHLPYPTHPHPFLQNPSSKPHTTPHYSTLTPTATARVYFAPPQRREEWASCYQHRPYIGTTPALNPPYRPCNGSTLALYQSCTGSTLALHRLYTDPMPVLRKAFFRYDMEKNMK